MAKPIIINSNPTDISNIDAEQNVTEQRKLNIPLRTITTVVLSLGILTVPSLVRDAFANCARTSTDWYGNSSGLCGTRTKPAPQPVEPSIYNVNWNLRNSTNRSIDYYYNDVRYTLAPGQSRTHATAYKRSNGESLGHRMLYGYSERTITSSIDRHFVIGSKGQVILRSGY